MSAGIPLGKTFLVFGFFGCLDVTRSVGTSLYDLLTTVLAEIKSVISQFAVQPLNGNNQFCFHILSFFLLSFFFSFCCLSFCLRWLRGSSALRSFFFSPAFDAGVLPLLSCVNPATISRPLRTSPSRLSCMFIPRHFMPASVQCPPLYNVYFSGILCRCPSPSSPRSPLLPRFAGLLSRAILLFPGMVCRCPSPPSPRSPLLPRFAGLQPRAILLLFPGMACRLLRVSASCIYARLRSGGERAAGFAANT